MKLDTLAPTGFRLIAAVGFAGMLSACAAHKPQQQTYAPPQPAPVAAPAAVEPNAPVQVQVQVQQAPPSQVVQAPVVQQPQAQTQVQSQAQAQAQTQAQVQQTQQIQRQQQVQRAPQQPREQQIAVGGTAFPVDGTRGVVPQGSRLVVRVYDAAGGDVNVRAAEGAFRVSQGLPARYKVPVPAPALQTMELPAVAARVEGPGGRVIYRNETAVLLQDGEAGDIPMTRQRAQAASAVTREWTLPMAK